MDMRLKRVLMVVLAVVGLGAVFFAAYEITLLSTKNVETNTPAASVADAATVAVTIQNSADGTTAALQGAAGTDSIAAVSPEQTLPNVTDSAGNSIAPDVTVPDTTAAAQSSAADPATPTYINGILIVNKTYAFPRSYEPGGLTSECLNAFYEMQAAAEEEGLDLYIASGFRSYELQSSLYQRYCDSDGQEAADTYSARPGHSEHETGLAIDLNDISSSFAYTAEGQWVAEHCWEYGFILRYPADKVAITGYMYEPWHIRYLGRDVASAVYSSGLCLEEYLGVDSVYRY